MMAKMFVHEKRNFMQEGVKYLRLHCVEVTVSIYTCTCFLICTLSSPTQLVLHCKHSCAT